jgi:hypothetical protein
MQLAATRKSDMIKNCQGLNKTNYGLNAAMKQNCYMSYALDDCEEEIAKHLPTVVTLEYLTELGMEANEDTLKVAELAFAKIRTGLQKRYKPMRKSLFHEKQQYHICQAKNMDYLKLYSGNALLSEESTKRMVFWDKVQNTRDNQAKQQANQLKSAKNAASADFRKKGQNQAGGGQSSSNYSKGGGGQQSGGGKPWTSNSNESASSSSSYQGNNFQKPFTPKKCPKCLENWHAGASCKT